MKMAVRTSLLLPNSLSGPIASLTTTAVSALSRGDRVLLMLGNIPPLWETMLAMMKLGAVIIPATTLLTANDRS